MVGVSRMTVLPWRANGKPMKRLKGISDAVPSRYVRANRKKNRMEAGKLLEQTADGGFTEGQTNQQINGGYRLYGPPLTNTKTKLDLTKLFDSVISRQLSVANIGLTWK